MNYFSHLCGSLFCGLVVLFEFGGLVLLLYICQTAKRDNSNAFKPFNASLRIQSGLCEPIRDIKKKLKVKTSDQ